VKRARVSIDTLLRDALGLPSADLALPMPIPKEQCIEFLQGLAACGMKTDVLRLT
jgi:hypothetical protein